MQRSFHWVTLTAREGFSAHPKGDGIGEGPTSLAVLGPHPISLREPETEHTTH